MQPVTDPSVLAQLNGTELKPVTDPKVLASLDAPDQPERTVPLDEALVRNFAQGITFNTADEISSGIRAGIDKLKGGSFTDSYNKNVAEARAQDNQIARQRPVASGLAQAAGGIVQAAGIPVAPAASSLARIAQGASLGAGLGAASGAGAADGGPGERFVGAVKGGTVGGLAGAAGAGISEGVSKIATRVFGEKVAKKTADTIRAEASQLYDSAEKAGGVLKPNVTDKFIDEATKVMPQTPAGKMLAGDSPVTKIVDNLQNLRGKNLTLQEAQEVDEFLGDAIDSFTELGRVNKEGKKLLDIQSAFRDTIENASASDVVGGKAGFDALSAARSLWSRAAKLRDIEKIITRAELSDNPASAIKSGFKAMATNPARMRGFSDEEAALVKRAAESGQVTDALRAFGSKLIPIITAASGGGVGATAAATAGSMASKGAATSFQLSRAMQLADKVAGNVSPEPLLAFGKGSGAQVGSLASGALVSSERRKPLRINIGK
ncbi:hypothetical protein CSIRO_3060 [Bradyrhizobiaceae bacterium SG-6C]|nr:hypothetical protein CSIRO_3060 [Bradyrhizobiaceae bacterium SG-6C]